AEFERGNVLRRARALVPVLVPLFVSAFRRADELALAMEARCYRGGEHRTRMKELHLAPRDGVALLLTFAVSAIFTIPYSTWQRLQGRPSGQAELERAVWKVTGQRRAVTGAGRTDAGVHALGQVGHFATANRLAAGRFPAALNAYLPMTIRVLGAEEVDAGFHARYAAIGRTYRYAVLNRHAPSAFLRNHAYYVPYPLRIEAIVACAVSLA